MAKVSAAGGDTSKVSWKDGFGGAKASPVGKKATGIWVTFDDAVSRCYGLAQLNRELPSGSGYRWIRASGYTYNGSAVVFRSAGSAGSHNFSGIGLGKVHFTSEESMLYTVTHEIGHLQACCSEWSADTYAVNFLSDNLQMSSRFD